MYAYLGSQNSGQVIDYHDSNLAYDAYDDDYNLEAIGDFGMDEFVHSSPSPPERTTFPSGFRGTRGYEITRGSNQQVDLRSNAFDRPDNSRNHPSERWAPATSYRSQLNSETWGAPVSNHPITISHRKEPLNTHGIRLHPVSDLPDTYRALFKFGVFNAVQSTCFQDICHSNENMVISSPTGSGKTVLFELAIVRLFHTANADGAPLKCVYIAPTKALCSERYRDWAAKFDPLGIICCELTGDTVAFGQGAWGDAKKASIIVTTAEKWDSLTRNWGDHQRILAQIKLFLVDEVHILNESRGSTLEVVVARMKTRGACVRFLLVSATVPNIIDVARWIESSVHPGEPAKVFEFGEEFRPCKLQRSVIGVHRAKGQNDFAFSKSLDSKLFPALQRHSVNKPILVFCATRKGVFATAEQLLKDFKDAEQNKETLPWSLPVRFDPTFLDKRLNSLASNGIGVHHAGLALDDRRRVEDLFLKGTLRIVVATSTLAVGVNLPAHMVVIKGVKTFQNNKTVEYSDLDIMQMLGRAGRPQFDKDGQALILCEAELEGKYQNLVQGRTILESCLHTNLCEHLNSEIGLGTVTTLQSATHWLQSSFFFQRMKSNPNYYAVEKQDGQSWEDRISDMILKGVEDLTETQLVEHSQVDHSLRPTEFGDIMSKFYIRKPTMAHILALPERPTLRDFLEMLSASEEFSDQKLRAGERTALNNLRRNQDIRFAVKKVDKTVDKIFLLIQAVLGCIPFNTSELKAGDSQLQMEAFSVFRHISRIAKAAVEVAVVKQAGAQIKIGLEVVRCLHAKAWEDRPVVLRQLEQIGEKSIKVLAENGITSIQTLRQEDSFRLETLLNRRSPFGLEILASAQEFPKYFLNISEIEKSFGNGLDLVNVSLSVECGIQDSPSTVTWKKGRKSHVPMTCILTTTSDLVFIDFRRIPTKSLATRKTFEVFASLTRPSQSIVVIVSSETLAGASVAQSYKPNVSANHFPTPDTRPITSLDRDLADLGGDPNFWAEMEAAGESSEEQPQVRVLTKKTRTGRPETLDANLDHPRVLPSGNYECNHPCKDKTSCRHLCCRDGVSALPHNSRRKIKLDAKRPFEPFQNPPKQNAPKKQALLHGNSIIRQSSKVSQRKKLQPDFGVTLFNLGDSGLATERYELQPTFEDDEDELPDSVLQFSPLRVTNESSETAYCNSEVDSLIRDFPLGTKGDCSASSSSELQVSSTLKRKEQRLDDTDDIHVKRPKIGGSHLASSPSVVNTPHDLLDDPLFHNLGSDLSDADEPTPCQTSSAPTRNDPASQFHATLKSQNSRLPIGDIHFPGRTATKGSHHGGFLKVASTDMQTDGAEDEDEFAEMDRWLTSGGVELVKFS